MKKRKFKTKVVLEALKEVSILSELAKKYNLAPTQISSQKKHFLKVENCRIPQNQDQQISKEKKLKLEV